MSARITLIPVARRTLSSSSSHNAAEAATAGAQKPKGRKGRQRVIFHSRTLKPFQFNDIPTVGYKKLMSMKETLELGEKVRDHEALLKSLSAEFKPPTSPLRLTHTVDLVHSAPKIDKKRSILVPVSSLPLQGPDAVHRIKIIAGPRWSPGRPGLTEMEYETESKYNGGPSDIGKDGWIKISEDRFEEPAMNRKSISDMLDRLIAAANDAKSPISTDVPVDIRHLIARRRRQKGALTHAQTQVLAGRESVRGAAVGFPKEWLSDEVKQRAQSAKQRTIPV